jgi:hypothetical protein
MSGLSLFSGARLCHPKAMRRWIGFLVFGSLVACGTDVDDLFGEATGSGGDGASSTTQGGAPNTNVTNGPAQQATNQATTQATTVGQSVTTGDPVVAQVPCAEDPCLPGQICCLSRINAQLDMCSDNPQCGEDAIPLACNGPEDCPGQICCGRFQNNQWRETACKSQCDGNDDLVMCTGSPDICDGAECRPSQFLGMGYAYCAN